MRFTTYLRDGRPRLAVVDGDKAIDIAADLRAELEAGRDLVAAGRAAIASNAPRLKLADLAFGCCCGSSRARPSAWD
ncbi:MAG: hypothetical protein U1F50_21420 [Rubrivivax sp.]